MDIQKFSEHEIPYDNLMKVGFSQQMIDDLPQSIMEKLLSGEKTPLLSSSLQDGNGKPMRACIWLSRESDGAVDVLYRPYIQMINISDFSKDEQKELMSGGVVLTKKEGQELSYYQLDEDTNQIISCPVSCLQHNFEVLQKELKNMDEKAFSEGKVQTYMEGGYPVTLGIDLSDKKAIRIVNGTLDTWKQEKEEKNLQKYNFGIYGCWTLDKDKNLTYVPEEGYTEDIIQAQNEQMERNRNRGMSL